MKVINFLLKNMLEKIISQNYSIVSTQLPNNTSGIRNVV